MIAVLLDTALLAIPNYAVDGLSAEEIIGRSFEIHALIADGVPISFYHNPSAQEALWLNNCGPDFDTISEFLNITGLNHIFATNDVLRSYNTIIDRSTDLSELGFTVDTFTNFKLEPDEMAHLVPVSLAAETRWCLANAALHLNRGSLDGFAPGWCVDDKLSVTVALRITSTIPEAAMALPADISETVPLLNRPFALCLLGWSKRIWNSAVSNEEIHLAIAVRAMEILWSAGMAPDEMQLVDFTVGPDFYTSLCRTQSSGVQPFSSVCLDICGQIVARTCNKYQGKMGRPNQTVRATDNAGAMRVHLTDSHAALRLMYWDKDGGIEFANVGPKFELLISEGAPGAASVLDVSLLAA